MCTVHKGKTGEEGNCIAQRGFHGGILLLWRRILFDAETAVDMSITAAWWLVSYGRSGVCASQTNIGDVAERSPRSKHATHAIHATHATHATHMQPPLCHCKITLSTHLSHPN